MYKRTCLWRPMPALKKMKGQRKGVEDSVQAKGSREAFSSWLGRIRREGEGNGVLSAVGSSPWPGPSLGVVLVREQRKKKCQNYVRVFEDVA